MNRVLFLDADGVLNNGTWAEKMYSQGVRIYQENLLYEPSLRQLKRIVDATGAVIVVSSAWRQIPTAYQRLREQMAGFGLEIHDRTPYVAMDRGDDITAWFWRNPGAWQYAILDDDDDMGVHRGHLVQTMFSDGLTEKDADRCIELLCSSEPVLYVLTERMITASERLCEEAMAQDGAFDPYRAQMTSAMTEEMFFTSFVEGAQIPLQQAMDFLQRGTEPEDIQEQMIWNNRHAWAEMTATLYRPLDEGFIKALAFTLTEEMDGCAQDYRQTDSHPIAAMGSESYDVPPSYALPDRMREYYDFLGQPDVHPLIKSAVAQAYILVARPFPEGNERLSRMLSSAVLLRCGYDFFRDISLSAVIAKESYRYYKAMREILRPENGGDLTYFVEYFLELLVRAVDARKERLRRREQEALEKEREMARQTLQGADAPDGTNGQQFISMEGSAKDTENQHDQNVSAKGPPQTGLMSLDEYEARIETVYGDPRKRKKDVPSMIKEMLDLGKIPFTTRDWSAHWHVSFSAASCVCRELLEVGLLLREPSDKGYLYSIPVELSSLPSSESRQVNQADSSLAKHAAAQSVPEEKGMLGYLKKLQQTAEFSQTRICAVLIELLHSGKQRFTGDDWRRIAQVSKSAGGEDLRKASRMGLIRKTSLHGASGRYEIVETPPKAQRFSDLSIAEKYYLTRVFSQYGNREFTTNDFGELLGLSKYQTPLCLDSLFERGILERRREGYNQAAKYHIVITPEEHPECFAAAEIQSPKQKATYPRVAAGRRIAAVG